MNKKQLIIPMLGIALLGGAGAGAIGFAHAQSATVAAETTSHAKQNNRGVAGTVSAVSGSTITLADKDGKTYTIDALAATVEKMQTSAVGDIKAGDTLMVQGTVNGSSVTANHIMNGKLGEGRFGGPGGHRGGPGHGEPAVLGTVSAISGSTLTVSGKNGTSYTVDAASAKFMKSVSGAKPTESTLGAIALGDTVCVIGTVNGTSVTAAEVIDGIPQGGPRGPGGPGQAPWTAPTQTQAQ
jgi:hypothetical protein